MRLLLFALPDFPLYHTPSVYTQNTQISPRVIFFPEYYKQKFFLKNTSAAEFPRLLRCGRYTYYIYCFLERVSNKMSKTHLQRALQRKIAWVDPSCDTSGASDTAAVQKCTSWPKCDIGIGLQDFESKPSSKYLSTVGPFFLFYIAINKRSLLFL